MRQTGFRKWISLLVIVIGTFMAILDSSIVNIAIPKMMAVFGASSDEIEWILTGYMLTMGVVIPLTGYLGERFGLKKVYVYALALFTIGSALCGMAWSTQSMIAARIIQALGGGVLMPVSMTLIFNIFPREQIGTALGVWGIASMAAPAIGPTLSGYIIEHMDWRIIFTVNIPIGIMAFVLSYILLPHTPSKKGSRFDYVGSISVVTGLFSLLLALNKGNAEGWTSMYIFSLFSISFISLVIFIANELIISEPLLDLGILKNFTFTLGQVITVITTIALFGGVFFIPLYLQNIKGLTPMETGMLMFPSALATGIVMPISGKLCDMFGARILGMLGLVVLAFTTHALSLCTLYTSNDTIMHLLMIRGIGMGLAMMSIQTFAVSEISTEKMGHASAISGALRQIGGSFGIAILSSIMSSRQAIHTAYYASSLNMLSPEGRRVSALFSALGSGIKGKVLSSTMLSQIISQQAFITSMDDAFLITFFICLFGLLLTFFIKKKSSIKHDKSTQNISFE